MVKEFAMEKLMDVGEILVVVARGFTLVAPVPTVVQYGEEVVKFAQVVAE